MNPTLATLECADCMQPIKAHPVIAEDGGGICSEFVLEIDEEEAAALLPEVWAQLTEVRAERDALRLDLLSIQGCQDAALPGWAWVPKDRIYAKWTERGDPLVQVKADCSPPYLYDTDPRGGGYERTGVGRSNRKIGFGCSASPRQAMRDADAAILKAARPKVPHAR